tara:strand:- start:642 stop:851 length:210 start_codon:yes stop_codon:yes gene_type:complete
MKTLIIIILILLVLGLYFIPDITKNIMKTTGQAVSDISKEGIEKIEEIEKSGNLTETIKDKIPIVVNDD